MFYTNIVNSYNNKSIIIYYTLVASSNITVPVVTLRFAVRTFLEKGIRTSTSPIYLYDVYSDNNKYNNNKYSITSKIHI